MPSPSARLAQFRLLLSSETKVPVRLGAGVGAPGRRKPSSRRGTDRRRGCGERPCAERFGHPGSRGRTERPRRRGRGGRQPCAPSTGGCAHLAPAHLSGWAARPESEGKGRREARRSRRSRRRRRRLPDSGESFKTQTPLRGATRQRRAPLGWISHPTSILLCDSASLSS